MLTLNFEGYAACYGTSMERVRFSVSGETPEEVRAKAAAEATRRGVREFNCVGLHNRRADFEAVYGAVDPEKRGHFADYSPAPTCSYATVAAAKR